MITIKFTQKMFKCVGVCCVLFLMSFHSNAQTNLIPINEGPKISNASWSYTAGVVDITDNANPSMHSAPDAYALRGLPNKDTLYSPLLNVTSAAGTFEINTTWNYVNYQESALSGTIVMSILVDGALIANISATSTGSSSWAAEAINKAVLTGTHTVQMFFTNSSIHPMSIDDVALSFVGASDVTLLPIILNTFKSSIKGNDVLLNWSTATESNNKGFFLERSNDQGITFNTIDFELSKGNNGNSSANLSYNFTDAYPINGDNYYRLKQIDLDSKATYSFIVLSTINNETPATISVYPNPAINNLSIKGAETGAIIKIISMGSGQLISSSILSSSNLDVSTLLPGMYSLQILSNNKLQTFKFLKNQ